MKKNSKKRIALYAIIAVVLIAALYLMNNPITGNAITNTNTTTAYDFSRENNPDYYSLLPTMPSDFNQIKLMWTQQIIGDDPVRINSSYWEQPEWFPMYTESFLPTLQEIAKDNRLPIWSLGIFDSQIYRGINQDWLKNTTEIPKAGYYEGAEIKDQSIVVKNRFWMRAAPGAVKIYGVGLSDVYPSQAYFRGNVVIGLPNETVIQDSETTKKYIKISAVEDQSGATEFNFGTYWPKLSPDYIKQIDVTTEISKDTPKGLYVVGIDAGAPSKDYQEEQSLKYLLLYTDPNIGMFRGPSEFRLFIEVM